MLQNIFISDTLFDTDYPKTMDAWKDLERDVAESIPIELNGMLLGNNATTDREKQKEGEMIECNEKDTRIMYTLYINDRHPQIVGVVFCQFVFYNHFYFYYNYSILE